MAEDLGRRERKRQRTRQALIDAAMRLFQEKGYDQTTLAEVTAAADVSTKTFFNYFASKDEVLFAEQGARFDAGIRIIDQHLPGEGMVDVLIRAMEHMLSDAVDNDLTNGLAARRLPLLMSVPSVQAATLRRYFLAETQLAHALHRAYPDTLDWPTAATIVGGLMGAVMGASVASLQQGDTPDQVRDATQRAIKIAVSGLRTAEATPDPSRPDQLELRNEVTADRSSAARPRGQGPVPVTG